MRPPSLPIAYLCLALSMVLVGSYVALSKPLVAVFPVLLLAWLRFAIGAVAMLHWLPAPAHEAPLSRRTHGLLFFEALIGNFLFTLCMVAGVSLTGAVAAGVVMAAIPAAVALLSWLVLKEHIGPRTWMAVALAVLGIGLYALSKQELPALATQGLEAKNTQYPTWWGPLLLVGAMLCEAIYSVLGKKLTASLGPKRITALVNLWGLALATPLGLYAAWQFDFAAVGPGTWVLLVCYALAACVASVWLWMTGLQTVPAAQGGVFTVLLPISAAVVGVVVLGETLQPLQLLAFVLALASVVLATWPTRAPPSQSALSEK